MYLACPNNVITKILRCLIITMLLAAGARAQSVSHHAQNLSEATTAKAFDERFLKMMSQFHDGKLLFMDQDVLTIVDIAKAKAFADEVLPSVYGWAGTMFGNGRMDEAIVFFMESALLYEKKNKSLAEALSYFEIALIQHKAENYEEAIEYYNKTLALGRDSLDHRTKINCLNGLALVLRERSEYDEAKMEFENAYTVALHHRDTAWMGILAGNIGSIHKHQESYDSSLHYYFKNLRLIKRTAEVENEIETYVHLGRLFIQKQSYKKALSYIDSAAAIIKDRKILFNDFFNPMDYINESYALTYSAMGDYKRAFDYYQKFHQVAQDKQRQLKGRSLKQLQSAYAFNQKQAELELLKKVNDANLLVIRQQRYTEIASYSVIVLLSALVFIAFRTGRQRKKLNKELFHSNAELGRLNTVKDKLFSVISHDLRGPLANLKSILLLLNEGHLKEGEFAELSGKLGHQLEASGDALENLLQWAKAQLSEIKVNPEKVAIADVADKIIHQFKEDLGYKSISCYNELPDTLTAWADKNQVEIILRNLVSNAIKFTPKAGVIRIGGVQNGNAVEVCVQDSGVGMTEGDLQNLFHPDKRFSRPGTNQEKGTGIGLLITKEMIGNNGGTIRVNSERNQGSTFTFTLPAMVS